MYRLQENITGQAFNNLMEFCFKNSSFFSLTVKHSKTKHSFNEIETLLEPFLITKLKTDIWYECFNLDEYNDELLVHIFESNNFTKNIILKLVDNVFMDTLNNDILYENLCFFSDRTILLGSISHAEFLNMYTDDINLSEVGVWEKENDKCRLILDESYRPIQSYKECLKSKIKFV